MNPYFILAGILSIGISFGVGYYNGYDSGKEKIQAEWDKAKADAIAKHAEELRQARDKEQSWQKAANNIQKEKDNEIRKLNATHAAIVHSLRDRKDRPESGMPDDPDAKQDGQHCTGKELFRSDAEFLAREAARADEIRIALKQCYAQYDSIKE